MKALVKPHMTVDEYLEWAVGQPGRFELYRGEVYVMSPETSGHADAKYAVQLALAGAIRRGNLSCHMLPDGMTVRIDDDTAYEPDALIYCGQKLPPSAIEVPDPMIVVEVLSPSTRCIDVSRKLVDYFRLPSVLHYLIIDLVRPLALHHTRGSEDTIVTRIFTEGTITLNPPGIEIVLHNIFGA